MIEQLRVIRAIRAIRTAIRTTIRAIRTVIRVIKVITYTYTSMRLTLILFSFCNNIYIQI